MKFMADLSRHYVRHLQGVFPRDLVRELRSQVHTISADTPMLSERDAAAISRGEKPEAVRLNPVWYRIWQEAEPKVLAELSPFTLINYPPQVRQITGPTQEVRWHQDAGFVKVMARPHRQIITCFVPLDDDPATRCTLQFTQEEPPFLEHAPTKNGFAAGLEASFKDLYHFDLSLGDCLIFGDLVPHRTYAPPNTIWERTSLEFRAIQPSDMLDEKDYFDLNTKSFIQKDGSSPISLV